MASEDHYHSPFNTNDNIQEVHYEAPACLQKNLSGSVYISNGPVYQTPVENILRLDSRLRYNGHSPTGGHERYKPGEYSPQHSSSSENSSNRRSENGLQKNENFYCNEFTTRDLQYNVGTFDTRLETTFLNRGGGVGENKSQSQLNQNESNKNVNR